MHFCGRVDSVVERKTAILEVEGSIPPERIIFLSAILCHIHMGKVVERMVNEAKAASRKKFLLKSQKFVFLFFAKINN